MKKKKDAVLEKELRRMRKIAVVIRLLINTLLAFLCAAAYRSENSTIRNIMEGNFSDALLIFVLIDTLIVLGWLVSDKVMVFHFWVHSLLFIFYAFILLINAPIGYTNEVAAWLIISGFAFLPFIVCILGSNRILRPHKKE